MSASGAFQPLAIRIPYIPEGKEHRHSFLKREGFFVCPVGRRRSLADTREVASSFDDRGHLWVFHRMDDLHEDARFSAEESLKWPACPLS